jgi:hypothetical protein
MEYPLLFVSALSEEKFGGYRRQIVDRPRNRRYMEESIRSKRLVNIVSALFD